MRNSQQPREVWTASEADTNCNDEIREGQIKQGIVRTLASQCFEKSDMIKLSFKKVVLPAVWGIHKRSTGGSQDTSSEAAAIAPQRNVCSLGPSGTVEGRAWIPDLV